MFTEQGNVKLVCRKKDNYFEFTVSDTSKGIHSEYNERKFNRFDQVFSSPIRQNEGRGYGLAIANVYVDLPGCKHFIKVGLWLDQQLHTGNGS